MLEQEYIDKKRTHFEEQPPMCLEPSKNKPSEIDGRTELQGENMLRVDVNASDKDKEAKDKKVQEKEGSMRHVNRFTVDEVCYLESRFCYHKTPDRKTREEITKQLNKKRHRVAAQKKTGKKVIELTQMKIKYWFDHKRRKMKAKRMRLGMERNNKFANHCSGGNNSSSSLSETGALEPVIETKLDQNNVCQNTLQLLLNNMQQATQTPSQPLWDAQSYLQHLQVLALMAMQYKGLQSSANTNVFQLQPNDVLLSRGAELCKGFMVTRGKLKVMLYANKEDSQPLFESILPEGSYLGPSKECGIGNMLIQAQTQCQIVLV